MLLAHAEDEISNDSQVLPHSGIVTKIPVRAKAQAEDILRQI
jgi:hypothetical protein